MSEKEEPSSQKESEKKEKRGGKHIRGIWAATIIFILAAIVAAGAWYFVLTDNPVNLNFKFNKISKEEQKETEEESNYNTYKNTSVEFSFDYPQEWILIEGNNLILVSSSKDYGESYLAGQEAEFTDQDIYIRIDFSSIELGTWRDLPSGSYKPQESSYIIGNEETTKYTYYGTYFIGQIVPNLKKGDFYFTISMDTHKDNQVLIDEYNKMLDSMKFGEEIIN